MNVHLVKLLEMWISFLKMNKVFIYLNGNKLVHILLERVALRT